MAIIRRKFRALLSSKSGGEDGEIDLEFQDSQAKNKEIANLRRRVKELEEALEDQEI